MLLKKGDDFVAVVRGGEPAGGLAMVVPGVDFRAVIEQVADHLEVAALGGGHQGRAARPAPGVDLGAALAIAIPFGMLGSLIQNFGYVINSFSHEVMVKHVHEKKYNLLYLDAYGIPGLIMTAPILLPIATEVYHIDPRHFGVVIVVNLVLGLMTPPVGLSFFVASAVTGAKPGKMFIVTLPFFIISCVALVMLSLFPSLSLGLLK